MRKTGGGSVRIHNRKQSQHSIEPTTRKIIRKWFSPLRRYASLSAVMLGWDVENKLHVWAMLEIPSDVNKRTVCNAWDCVLQELSARATTELHILRRPSNTAAKDLALALGASIVLRRKNAP